MEDKEKEIRLQFLDEAKEYLDTLESAMLGVAQRGVDSYEINGALRAAHSIKGGAALMGYGLTSELAHRLEDSLKVLKINRSAGVTADVESQMLRGVDAIRQVVERDRTATPLDDRWVNSSVLPIFDGLYDRLGEPSAEDAASMMDADEGQNVMPLIFQTEVESALERLEILIDEPSGNLQAELVTMAQELGGLGEMLDLPQFIRLCQSVDRYAARAANASQLQEVTDQALQVWRRAQALVLTGNQDAMPDQLVGMSFTLAQTDGRMTFEGAGFDEADMSAESVFAGFDVDTGEDDDASVQDDAPLVGDVFADLEADAGADLGAGLGTENDALVGDVFAGLNEEPDDLLTGNAGFDQGSGEETDAFADVFEGLGADQDSSAPDRFSAQTVTRTGTQADAQTGAQAGTQTGTRVEQPSPQTGRSNGKAGTEFRFSEAPKTQVETADLGDNTVRVSVRKLNELNDYFGELTIERNRLETEVKRMRSLVKDLSRKLRSLDEVNDDVRDLYEQPERQLLLASGRSIDELPAAVNAPVAQSLPVGGGAALGGVSSATAGGAPYGGGFRQGFDTLEFDRYNDAHLPFRQIVESVVKLQEVADDIELSVDKTEQTTRVIHRTARYLQRNLNQLRMRPLSDVTNRFPRALRELELAHGKSVELALEGEGILVDRNILEALSDPLMHIVRNAFDHGIEKPQQREAQGKTRVGTIAIKAFNRSNRTVITVSDDGNGIALEKIRDRALSMGLDADLLEAASEAELLSLIFEPGFSTSDEVTALSGRGVGMDVVRNNLTQIRGDINVNTEVGKGTIFTLSVPYTLSVTRVMLAEAGRMPIALPTDLIEEVALISTADLFETEGYEMFHFKGDAIRLIRLSKWLAFNCPQQFDSLEEVPTMDRPSVLLFRMGDQRLGIEIDKSWGEREVAVRRVEGPISLPAGFSNCTILGDGQVIPLLSLPDFARWVLNCEAANISSAKALYSNPVAQGAIDPVSLQTLPDPNVNRSARLLVIDDSVNVRRLLALTLEKAGYEVEQARDGQDAMDKLENGLVVDGVVCDVEMPRMDGYSFLSKLRSARGADSRLPLKFSDIPVTMLTSRSGDKHRTLAMNLGATAYFAKPYQERVLLKSLADSLAAAKKRKQAE